MKEQTAACADQVVVRVDSSTSDQDAPAWLAIEAPWTVEPDAAPADSVEQLEARGVMARIT